jgi:hypothetical protein
MWYSNFFEALEESAQNLKFFLILSLIYWSFNILVLTFWLL